MGDGALPGRGHRVPGQWARLTLQPVNEGALDKTFRMMHYGGLRVRLVHLWIAYSVQWSLLIFVFDLRRGLAILPRLASYF